MAPPRLIVAQAADTPAADCAVASLLADRLAAGAKGPVSLVRLRRTDAAFPQPGSAEHVLAEGRLADNSLLWAERADGPRLRVQELPDLPEPGGDALVVAWNPLLAPDRSLVEIERRLGPDALALQVAGRDGVLEVRLAAEGAAGRGLAAAERDLYGRWRLEDRGLAERLGLAVSSGPASARGEKGSSGPRVVVVGEAGHFREVFPAVSAALGDAAEQAGLAARIDCVSPRGLDRGDWAGRLAAADGLVLPGGSDLGQVEGQIQAAALAAASGLPTIGLCLGMQTMTAAVARRTAGLPEANLEEAEPGGACHVFRRLKDEGGRPWHRLGAVRTRVLPGSRLAACCGEETLLERVNHRYALNEDLADRLESAGLRISARGEAGTIADAVELPDHPFFHRPAEPPGAVEPAGAAATRCCRPFYGPPRSGVRPADSAFTALVLSRTHGERFPQSVSEGLSPKIRRYSTEKRPQWRKPQARARSVTLSAGPACCKASRTRSKRTFLR